MKKNRIAIIGLTGQSIFMTVDQFHKDGETKQANTLYIEPGGKGYNQAIACKKLESDVYFLTAVGNDEHGKECKSSFPLLLLTLELLLSAGLWLCTEDHKHTRKSFHDRRLL